MFNTIFKRDLRQKSHHCFYGIILMILWEKNFVQTFESSVSDAIPATVQNNSSLV